MKRFLLFSVLILLSLPAQAQETYQCGVPDNPGIGKTDDPEFWRYCDIYARRYAYIEEQQDFRADMDERRRNYNAYRELAIENYKNEMELYHLLID